MKIRELFICLFFLLLGGGQYFYASTSTSIDKPFSKYFQEKHIKQVGADSFSNFIENSDFDNEEEYSAKKENKNEEKIKISKYGFFKEKYFIKSSISSFYFDTKNKLITRIKINSTPPIYILQGALRI